ncbi:MAG: OmpA family protein [Bacteroidetes bacterium]|nr:OmpA family protein [Bacteroidota bacterium]
MRLSTLAFTFLLCICATDLLAQTETTTQATSTVSGVDRLPKRNDYNTWEVGVHFGITYPNTDIAASDLNADNLKSQLGFGVHVSKFFSHSFALQGQFIHATLKGVSDKDPYYGYTTDINYEFSLNAVGHIGNIGFLKRTPNLGLYAYVGIGLMNFSPTNTWGKGDTTLTKNRIVQPNGSYGEIDYNPTSELVVPIGVGIKYRFAKKFSLHAEYSLRTTRSDKLDGFYRILSNDDDYSYINVGVTYHIGKKDKTIEWVNPLQTIYTDLYDTKDKVDMMSGDKDKDGVADMFDRDAATPEGVKVYGDGTSVDTDGDGVPDYLDAEPFSAKGAKVDAQGRELDADTDGIPDSRDMEPNTPKGTLVTGTGITIPTTGLGSSSSAVMTGYIPSVFFDVNSANVTPKYYEMLADIALVLKNNPSIKFEVVGNCDTRATEGYNKTLGEKRAEAVKNHLVKRYAIDESRLSVVTRGKDSPITSDHVMNRRVDFKVTQ